MDTVSPLPGVVVRNIGDPIRLTNVSLAGVTAENVEPSDKVKLVKVWTRLAITSDDPMFHKIASSLAKVIEDHARSAGAHIRINRAEYVLLVINKDNNAELWVDTAAVAQRCMVKRNMEAGSVLFENDIADINGVFFPCVDLKPDDKVLCLFRQDWRFALYFDFHPEGDFNTEEFISTLGALYRNLRYRHLYDMLADECLFNTLVHAGWFPFVEIIGDFKELATSCEAGFNLTNAEKSIIDKFDKSRLDRILNRWLEKPHFKAKASILKEAIEAFKEQKPIAVIKILLTEIEGIINDSYKKAHGKGGSLKELLGFAVESAERKAGGSDTLLFSAAFAKYLAAYTFANFDPVQEDGIAGSRHAVGHGAAKAESYTMARALQAILVLDQMAFFI